VLSTDFIISVLAAAVCMVTEISHQLRINREAAAEARL
jgi:hypothetical protein